MKTRKQSRKASQIRDCFLKLFPFYRKDGQIKHGKSMKYGIFMDLQAKKRDK